MVLRVSAVPGACGALDRQLACLPQAAQPLRLFIVHAGQLGENFFPLRRERNIHDAAIGGILRSHDQAAVHRPLHQAHDRVMPFLQKFSEFRDRCRSAPGKSPNTQHQLMLLRSYAAAAGGKLTEAQKFAQSIAKPRQLVHPLCRLGLPEGCC